ncbi:hypothetical protein EDB19DRAFT_1826783 [Suillus lakei]|nr:hypothetical protein EDB19DRAFT_1826783 [Suillus lakei]
MLDSVESPKTATPYVPRKKRKAESTCMRRVVHAVAVRRASVHMLLNVGVLIYGAELARNICSTLRSRLGIRRMLGSMRQLDGVRGVGWEVPLWQLHLVYEFYRLPSRYFSPNANLAPYEAQYPTSYNATDDHLQLLQCFAIFEKTTTRNMLWGSVKVSSQLISTSVNVVGRTPRRQFSQPVWQNRTFILAFALFGTAFLAQHPGLCTDDINLVAQIDRALVIAPNQPQSVPALAQGFYFIPLYQIALCLFGFWLNTARAPELLSPDK